MDTGVLEIGLYLQIQSDEFIIELYCFVFIFADVPTHGPDMNNKNASFFLVIANETKLVQGNPKPNGGERWHCE